MSKPDEMIDPKAIEAYREATGGTEERAKEFWRRVIKTAHQMKQFSPQKDETPHEEVTTRPTT
jgi:hypothetical protein